MPTPDEQQEAERRAKDHLEMVKSVEAVMSEMANMKESWADGSMVLPSGKTALEAVREHDDLFVNQNTILAQQVEIIDALEGKPIVSQITGEPTGEKELGALAKLDYLYQGANGGPAVKLRREWTTAQMWTIGLVVSLLGGILLLLVPIVIEIAQSTP